MSSFTPVSKPIYSDPLKAELDALKAELEEMPLEELQLGNPASLSLRQAQVPTTWLIFIAAAFLVSVPVLVQAALVRSFPWLSLGMTGGWLWLSLSLRARPATQAWGDLLLGFTWTWLAGSVYWGWLRWEPFWHLPIEAIGLPFAGLSLARGWGKVGNWFYLGSLFGTVVTDLYFYLVDVIPQWRQIMQTDPSLVKPIFQTALTHVQTPWGIECAAVLASLLLVIGCWPLRSQQLYGWAFSGAVLSTILVDGLFWLAALAD